MKLFMVTLFVGIATAAKLQNNYLPPNSASTAGGHAGFLQGPNQARPNSNYLPPTTTFNNAGQPNSFSQGGGGQSGFGALGGGQQGRYQTGGFGGQQGGFGGQKGGFGGQQGGFGGQKGGYGGAQGYAGAGASQYSGQSGQQIPILKYDNINNGDGSYHFDFATGNGIQQNEDGRLNNPGSDYAEQVVQGSYSYTGDDGQTYTVNYKADANGFQPTGDHLPTPPPIPEAILKSLEYNAAHPEENNAGAYSNAGSYGGNQGGFGGNAGGQSGSFGGAGRGGSFGGRPQQQYIAPQQQRHQSGGAGGAAGYHY